MFNYFRKTKFFILGLSLSFFASLFFIGLVLADTETDTATINATVPSVCGNGVLEGAEECDDGNTNDGDGCSATCQTEGGGGSGDSWPPTISNIVEDPGVTIAGVSWDATDASGIRICYFTYGLDTNYTETGTVSGSYETSLTGLDSETTYYYRIRCLDNNFNDAISIGSLDTLAGADSEAPVITITSTQTDVVSSTIIWQATDNVAVTECSFVYDDDEALEPYDLSGSVNTLGGDDYSVGLSGLTPSTLYFYKITCVDAIPNSASELSTFNTLADTTPPADVSNFLVTAGDGQVNLTWDYTDSISDFSHYIIKRDLNEPTDINDGDLVATIADISIHDYTDPGLANLTEYYYKIFAVDTSSNNSNGVWDSAIPHAANETGLCSDSLDNDLDGAVDCVDTDCSDDAACVGAVVEICTNGIDDDGDGAIDCADPDCAATQACVGGPVIGGEVCNNGLDDDDDGAIDCADSDCAAYPACVGEPTVGVVQCNDGIDNDEDGLIDLDDPGCEDSDDNDEYNAPEPGVEEEMQVSLEDVRVFLAERTILAQFADGNISTLPGDQLSVLVDRNLVDIENLESIDLYLNGDTYSFVLDALNDLYYVDVVVPGAGQYMAVIEIRYENDVFDVVEFGVSSLSYGTVADSKTDEPLSGVKISLVSTDQGDRLWLGSQYRQDNPQLTSANGRYGFVVPNGAYLITAELDGYKSYESPAFTVRNNVINRDIGLIFLPPKLEDVIDEEAPLAQNVKNVLVNLGQKATAQLEIVKELADDPRIEEVTEEIIAPAVLTAAAVAVVPSLWSFLWPLLRFLFLQPLLLVGKRKREGWGMVYNSYTKLPIDLAVVRLVGVESGRVVRSRVTDRQGRYVFITEPGEYYIQVIKKGFTFPSELLKEVKTDRELVDIYHGEVLKVTGEKVAITPNIPLDPVGETRTPKRIKWESRLRGLQHVISIAGILATSVSLYISPVWYLWLFLVAHLVIYSLFFVYVKPKKPKGWGIVYDLHTKKPIGKAIIRLFSKDYNKLVTSQLTDNKGRYSFLVGPNEYYVTVEKPGYRSERSEDINLKKSDKGLIKQDFTIQKE